MAGQRVSIEMNWEGSRFHCPACGAEVFNDEGETSNPCSHLLFTWVSEVRDVTSSTNERTVISSVIPFAGVGNNLPVLLLDSVQRPMGALLSSNLNCFALDFSARFKVGGLHLNFFLVEQFPVLPPERYALPCAWDSSIKTVGQWLSPRAMELIYTAWDLESFANDSGWAGPPFQWNAERRGRLRSELDAAYFHLYLPADKNGDWIGVSSESRDDLDRLKVLFPTPRDTVSYIMDTFPIVRRKDEATYGSYRTKDAILEIYDAMQQAIRSGKPYQTRLDPPPADPSRCHPTRRA